MGRLSGFPGAWATSSVCIGDSLGGGAPPPHLHDTLSGDVPVWFCKLVTLYAGLACVLPRPSCLLQVPCFPGLSAFLVILLQCRPPAVSFSPFNAPLGRERWDELSGGPPRPGNLANPPEPLVGPPEKGGRPVGPTLSRTISPWQGCRAYMRHMATAVICRVEPGGGP